MQLIHLEVFLAVIDEGSFSAAASRLRLSPSRVTERIQELERELHATLLHRSAGSARPTQAGVALAARARVVAQEVQTIHALFPPEGTAEIRVGMRSLPQDFRERVQRTIVRGAAGRPVSFVPLDSTSQMRMLKAGTLDCGIVWAPPPPPIKSLPLISETIAVVTPATRRYSSLHVVEPADLAGLTLASVVEPLKVPADLGHYLEYLPHVELVNLAVADALYLLVSSGSHCAFVPARSAEHASLSDETRRNILIKPLKEPAPQIRSYFAWRPEKEHFPAIGPVIARVIADFPEPERR